MNENEFKQGDVVRHLKTGNVYQIITDARLESTLEDVFVYRALAAEKSTWVRPKGEMQDGRFVLVTSNHRGENLEHT